MSERGTVSDQFFPRDIVERITNGLLFIFQQPLYHPWVSWEHEQYHGKIYFICTAFIWLFICCINCFFLLTTIPLLFSPPSSPPSFGFVASHCKHRTRKKYGLPHSWCLQKAWEMTYSIHIHSCKAQKTWGKCLHSVRASWNSFVLCWQKRGYRRASLLSLWLLREQVFPCSPPGGANTSHSVLTPGSVPSGALVLQHRFVFPVS